MRTAWAIYKKELRTFFVTPLFYVVAAVFLAVSGIYFASDLVLFVQFGYGMSILDNFWQLLFVDMRLAMMLTVPLLCIRAFAEERKLGTIELLYTYPTRDGEIYAGKFAACATVFLIMLALTASYPVYIYSIQPYDWIAVLAGYLGLVLLGFAFVACGLFVSSLTDSQVVAGVGSIALLLVFWIISWNEGAFSAPVRVVVTSLSMFDHFLMFARGVIDAVHVSYYVFFTLLFSVMTLRSMESRHWRGRR